MSGASDDIEKDAGDDDEEGAKAYPAPEAGTGTGNHPHGSQNININEMNFSHKGPLNVTINTPYTSSYDSHPHPHPPSSEDPSDAALHSPATSDFTERFQPGDLERTVEEKFFVPVARAFDEWCHYEPLTRELHLKSAELSELRTKHHDDVHELVCKILVKWMQRNPQGTVHTLVKALCNSGNYSPVMALKEYFDRNRN